MPALKDYWPLVLEDLRGRISNTNFKAWLAHTDFVEVQENGRKIVVSVPSDFHRKYIDSKFRRDLQESVKKYYPQVIHLGYQINKPAKEVQEIQQTLSLEPGDASNKVNNQPDTDSEPEKLSSYLPKKSLNNLNPKYSFENFVVTRNNALVAGVAGAVAEELGNLYNPLFIHSKVGLGKTHLLQAIGGKAIENKPGFNIKYIPAETFINQWILSLQRKETNLFRDYYNSIDLLLIDDIQFFAGKESTQEVFFHVFNQLHQNNKQIILTSDKGPQELVGIAERLVSRFGSGMVVDITRPELEDRLSILQDKVARMQLLLNPSQLQTIAERVQSNVRDLEGALNKIQARIRLMPGREFTDQDLEQILSSYNQAEQNLSMPMTDQSPDAILQAICRIFSLQKSDLMGSSREKNVAMARQLAFWFYKHELDLSYPTIGKLFGGRNHTTIMHGYNKIQNLLNKDPKVKDKIMMTKKILASSY